MKKIIKLSIIGANLIAQSIGLDRDIFNDNLPSYPLLNLADDAVVPIQKNELPIKKKKEARTSQYRYQKRRFSDKHIKTEIFNPFEQACNSDKAPKLKKKNASIFLNIAQDKKFEDSWRFIAAMTLWKDVELKKEGAKAYLNIAEDTTLMISKRLEAARVLLSYKEDPYFINQAVKIVKDIFQTCHSSTPQLEEKNEASEFLTSCINDLGRQDPIIQDLLVFLKLN